MTPIPSLAGAALDLIGRCRAGLVEPMLLEIRPAELWAAKFKALPGHPAPGDAGKGFSHPVRPASAPLAGPGTPFERMRIFPALPVVLAPDALMAAGADLATAIGWGDAALWLQVAPAEGEGGYLCQITPEMQSEARAEGQPNQLATMIPLRAEEVGHWALTLARGGALVYEDYPTDLSVVGTLGEQVRVARLRDRERECTSAYVSRRGENLRGRSGPVPGAGRPGPGGHPVPPEAKTRSIRLTDAEYVAVRALIAERRAQKADAKSP